MMFEFKFEGLQELQREIADFSERRLGTAVATAMTRTAVKTRDAVQNHMRAVFDRPKPYTVRQLRYVAATAKKPVAAVGFNIAAVQDVYGRVVRFEDLGPGETAAGKYLQFQQDGGQRRSKRFENALRQVGVLPHGWMAVPGERAKMDSYGNHSVGEIRQILSWFDAAELVAGSRQNMGVKGREKRKLGTKRKAGFEYFVVPAGASRSWSRGNGRTASHKMQPGIYRRSQSFGGSRLEPIIIFVRRTGYKPRFDFYGVAKREANLHLVPELKRAIDESRQRLAAKG